MEKIINSRIELLTSDYVKKQIACQTFPCVSTDLEVSMIFLKFSGSVSPSVLMTSTEQSDSFIRSRIGLKVFSTDHKEIGELIEIIRTGANDVYVIKPCNKNEKEILIPAIKSVVKNVNIYDKKMIVKVQEWR